jgi:hypothetical protein
MLVFLNGGFCSAFISGKYPECAQDRNGGWFIPFSGLVSSESIQIAFIAI